MAVSRFHIAGMDCGAEEQLVRMALMDLSGVGRIEVDLNQRSVTIEHDTNPAAIVEALDTLGIGAIAAVLGGSLPEPPVVARDFGPLVAERRLLMWTDDIEEQAFLDRIGMLGAEEQKKNRQKNENLAGGDEVLHRGFRRSE